MDRRAREERGAGAGERRGERREEWGGSLVGCYHHCMYVTRVWIRVRGSYLVSCRASAKGQFGLKGLQKRCRVKNWNWDFAAGSRKMPPTPLRNSLALLHDAPRSETCTKALLSATMLPSKKLGLLPLPDNPHAEIPT